MGWMFAAVVKWGTEVQWICWGEIATEQDEAEEKEGVPSGYLT